MERTIKILATCGAIMFFASTALALADDTSIGRLPDQGDVIVSGIVESVNSQHAFTLRDNTGHIDVNIASGESVVLKKGDKVTVSGEVEKPLWGLLGKNIAATDIEVHKDLGTALSDAVTKTTGLSLNRAETVRVGKLPDQGMVQVTGTVERVGDEKTFVLKDSTGSVKVNIQSDENVALVKGAEVTVTGYVNKGLLGKSLRATHVVVMADAPANTGHMEANQN